ncbi:hypothetical protein V2J09_021957 [Rumex salicifolius]
MPEVVMLENSGIPPPRSPPDTTTIATILPVVTDSGEPQPTGSQISTESHKEQKRAQTQGPVQVSEVPQQSFKDKLLKGLFLSENEGINDSFLYERIHIDMKDELGIPMVKVDKDALACLAKGWRSAIIIKLLGRQVAYQHFERKLREIWSPMGRFVIVDLPNNFSIVRFEHKQDAFAAFSGGPWTIFGQCLMVQAWVPEFQPMRNTISTICAWVHLVHLPMEKVIKSIASCLGTPIRVDKNRLNATRGKFARLCVAIDAS